MATINRAVTGRENFGDIISGFTKLTKRLDTYIGQRLSDAKRFTAAESSARSAAVLATSDVDRATRTKAKIADLVA